METIEVALPMRGGLMMDEDAASIVAQIKTLLKQLRTKGATDHDTPRRCNLFSHLYLVTTDSEFHIVKE